MSKNKKNNNTKWIITVMIVSFLLSIVFSTLSEIIIPNINIIFGIILIFVFIFIGIIFDMVGVAITASDETPFHSMASKKVKGSKNSIKLLKNSDKLASLCNDVVGDVCGVVSGGAGMLVATTIANQFKFNSSLTVLIVTAIIASITIGGKAIGKTTAIRNSEAITFKVGKILNIIKK